MRQPVNYHRGYLHSPGAGQTQFTYVIVESSFTKVILTTPYTDNIEKWVHGAIVRRGSTFYLFGDGELLDTDTYSSALNTIAQPLYVGSYAYYGAWYGYIDEFRISKGIARWNNEFTVPNRSYRPMLTSPP